QDPVIGADVLRRNNILRARNQAAMRMNNASRSAGAPRGEDADSCLLGIYSLVGYTRARPPLELIEAEKWRLGSESSFKAAAFDRWVEERKIGPVLGCHLRQPLRLQECVRDAYHRADPPVREDARQ